MAQQTFKIEGMDSLEKSIRKLGRVPLMSVTKAARSGMRISLSSAKNKAPMLTGDLISGLRLKPEKTRTKGKKVYQVTLDSAMSDTFVKFSKNLPGQRAYYPASQEYGFINAWAKGGYVPGFHYLLESMTENKSAIEKKVVDVMSKDIDKALKG